MAAEPKRSFKRTVASTVEGRSPGFLLSSLALAMVISILAGLVIGIQIGDNNDDKKTGKPTVIVNPTSTTRRGTKAVRAVKPPLKAVVVRKTPKLLVVTRGTRRVTLGLVRLTRVELTAAATASDIKAGSRVLFVAAKPAAGSTTTGGGASVLTVKEVIIVSGTGKGRLGTVVTSATPDSMTIKVKGKSVTVSTAGAKITKTVPGKPADLVAGAHVLIKTYLAPAPKKRPKNAPAKRQAIATEIVVLPATSAFA
jgi:hypothetical protein